MKRSLLIDTQANSCYFRTSVSGDGRKALIQITERCNLHCAHCFVSSGDWGDHLPLADVVETVLPRLRRARVERITLTGGEPFVHPSIMGICRAIASAGLPVGLCTNATQTTDEQIAELRALGGVHVNVSFDGFRPESHGKFRGSVSSFAVTKATTEKFAAAGLLQGLLSTPNALTNADEAQMRAIQAVTARFAERGLDLAHIRFPNDDKPLGGCDAGKLIYVFVGGEVAVCPYLVFAARTPDSRYADSDFLVGNILQGEVAEALDAYDFHRRFVVGANTKCWTCGLNDRCGKGCPAAVVADGRYIGAVDREQCPVPDDVPLLQIGRRPA